MARPFSARRSAPPSAATACFTRSPLPCANTGCCRFIASSNAAIDKAYFIEKYGDPDKKIAIDNLTDAWEYSFGHQRLSEYGARGNLSTAVLLRLTFKNGILVDWRAVNKVN